MYNYNERISQLHQFTQQQTMRKTNIIFSQDSLTIVERTEVRVIHYTDIVGIFCERPYLMIESICKNKKLITNSLKEIDQLLPDSFVICNRSAIINIKYIVQLKAEKNNNFAHLRCGKKILVSRRKKSDVVSAFKAFLTA